jgi:hypothetical protein
MRTTPGKIRLLLIGLIVLCLGWGALAAFSVAGYESAAGGVVRVNEPLTLDAQHIYQDLSDANDTEATAFLTGGLEPFSLRNRYLADVEAASAATETATSMEGAATGSTAASATSKDLLTLSTDLPVYTGEIETARADNRIGYPVGAAYLREATTLMNSSLLPAAEGLYTAENAQLTATSAGATGLPLVLATIVAGLVLGYVLYWTSRWLTRRTNRVLNPGLAAAGVMALIALIWFAAVYGGARGDLLAARSRGAVPVAALAQADIAALQAHADESLTLIDDAGDDQYQADYLRAQKTLGPGPGTLLSAVSSASAGSPGAGPASAAVAKARAWYTAHAQLREQDDNGDHAAAVASALGTGKTDAGGQFTAFESDVSSALTADQAALRASAQAGEDMYTGLEAGIIILALLMAAACAWGLNRRLTEYR